MDINTAVVSDALKTAANVTELLNKRSEKEKEDATVEATDNSYSNAQPQHQVVQVQLGDPNAPKAPVVPPVVKKKKETHIHREFPEDRAMTDAECSLALEKAKMEHELKLKEIEYREYREDLARKDRLDREARAREERERQEKERKEREEKEDRILGKAFKWLCGGIAGSIVFGGAFEVYKAWKKSKSTNTAAITPAVAPVIALPESTTTEANEK